MEGLRSLAQVDADGEVKMNLRHLVRCSHHSGFPERSWVVPMYVARVDGEGESHSSSPSSEEACPDHHRARALREKNLEAEGGRQTQHAGSQKSEAMRRASLYMTSEKTSTSLEDAVNALRDHPPECVINTRARRCEESIGLTSVVAKCIGVIGRRAKDLPLFWVHDALTYL